MAGFCSRCGAAALARSRFCANCGARLRSDPGGPVLSGDDLTDVTQEVPAVTAPADAVRTEDTISGVPAHGLRRAIDDALGPMRPKLERWWAQERGHASRNAMVFCGLLLLVAIIVAATVGGGGGGSLLATKRTRSTRAVAGARTPKRAQLITGPGSVSLKPPAYAFVAQLERILQQSAAGRTQLAGTVRSVQPSCGSPSLQAEQQLASVIQNRGGLLQQLDALGPGPDSTTQAISSLLHQAIEASTQADVQYRNWNAALARTDPEECSKDPSAAVSLAAAHTYDSNATTLKTQFVTLFNPLAAQLGLPTWSPADF